MTKEFFPSVSLLVSFPVEGAPGALIYLIVLISYNNFYFCCSGTGAIAREFFKGCADWLHCTEVCNNLPSHNTDYHFNLIEFRYLLLKASLEMREWDTFLFFMKALCIKGGVSV